MEDSEKLQRRGKYVTSNAIFFILAGRGSDELYRIIARRRAVFAP
jgi:hypothetical protein